MLDDVNDGAGSVHLSLTEWVSPRLRKCGSVFLPSHCRFLSFSGQCYGASSHACHLLNVCVLEVRVSVQPLLPALEEKVGWWMEWNGWLWRMSEDVRSLFGVLRRKKYKEYRVLITNTPFAIKYLWPPWLMGKPSDIWCTSSSVYLPRHTSISLHRSVITGQETLPLQDFLQVVD